MYLKKEKEFQYPPGIEKIIEDVIGGGTIDRSDFAGVAFGGKPLQELPPLVFVVKDNNTGIYKVIKTAKAHAAATATSKNYQVKKNHLFAVGDFVTVVAADGKLSGASDAIATIDKSNKDYDIITLAATVGAAVIDAVLISAKAKADAGSATLPYDGEVVLTMNKVDLTVANQRSGLLVRGTVNKSVLPFPLPFPIVGVRMNLTPDIHFV